MGTLFYLRWVRKLLTEKIQRGENLDHIKNACLPISEYLRRCEEEIAKAPEFDPRDYMHLLDNYDWFDQPAFLNRDSIKGNNHA